MKTFYLGINLMTSMQKTVNQSVVTFLLILPSVQALQLHVT